MSTLTPDLSPSSVRTPPVIPSCPICGEPLQGRQTVCSAKCRIARSRLKHEQARRALDAKVRLLLKTVIDAATEANKLLQPEEEPSR